MPTPLPCTLLLAGREERLVALGVALLTGFAGARGPLHAQEARAPVRHALLVGCSEYPELRKAFPERYEAELALHGPVKDVELLRATLEHVLGLAREHTTVLAGWEQDVRTRPTCASILAHLRRLASEARPGDQVIVYLAGHGSQQRVQRIREGEEPDGLEEIFLPADVRPAAKDQGHVPNSISDDELGERVRAIRDAGAEVWLIVDSCHSGTMLRGGGGDVRLRGIDPALLGVLPVLRGGRDRGPTENGWLDGSDVTRIAALYGATSYGRAPEMAVPRKAPDAERHGLFTWLLCQELQRAGPRATYAELAERVVAAYQAFPCAITVPTAEGDLAREVCGGLPGEAAFVCTLAGGEPCLSQGRLAGLEPGVEVQLLELAGGAETKVARMVITEADLFRARGRLLEGALAPERGPWRARADARPLDDYGLALALLRADGSPAAPGELPKGAALASVTGRYELVEPERADWWIVLGLDGRLQLRPGPREGGLDLCDVAPERLLETLAGIQKARNLRRFAGGAFTAEWRGDVEVCVERHGSRGWQRVERDDVLHPGEKIRVRLLKSSDAIYDVNVFYLDANFGTQLLPPKSGSPRLEASVRERELGEWVITDDALGIENILVFATPRTAASAEVDLRALEQRGLTRGAEKPDPFVELLRQVCTGDGMRGEIVRASSTAGTQSTLLTLRTDWGALAAPAWPAKSAGIERPQRESAGTGKKDLGGNASALPPEIPDPWELGTRAALRRSRPAIPRNDLLLLGGTEVEVVFVDFDQGVPLDSDPAQVARERAFDAEAAFRFGARRIAWYDRGDRGAFDLALEDADGDGVAETRWTLAEGQWLRGPPVALPWLSQGHVVAGARARTDAKADISARLQALQGAP